MSIWHKHVRQTDSQSVKQTDDFKLNEIEIVISTADFVYRMPSAEYRVLPRPAPGHCSANKNAHKTQNFLNCLISFFVLSSHTHIHLSLFFGFVE